MENGKWKMEFGFPCTAVVCLLFLLAGPVSAEQVNLKVSAGSSNLVTFTSKAPLETIVGKTDQISGNVSFDPDDLTKEVSAHLEVIMATIDTDNKVRNGHMRDNHLHTDKFPTSTFVLESLSPGSNKSLADGKTVTLKAKGKFTCHGVTRDIEPEVKVSWNASRKILSAEARFKVSLPDYDIPRPKFLVMKLEETQDVMVKFVAK